MAKKNDSTGNDAWKKPVQKGVESRSGQFNGKSVAPPPKPPKPKKP